MKNLNVNFENLTDEQQKQLLALVEESRKPKDVFAFECDERYWFIHTTGGEAYCYFDNDELDQERLDFGNAYHTKEQAETAAKAMRRYNRILQFAILHGGYREFVSGGDGVNFSVFADLNLKWFVGKDLAYSGGLVFMTKECAELLCEKLNSGEFEI